MAENDDALGNEITHQQFLQSPDGVQWVVEEANRILNEKPTSRGLQLTGADMPFISHVITWYLSDTPNMRPLMMARALANQVIVSKEQSILEPIQEGEEHGDMGYEHAGSLFFRRLPKMAYIC